MGRNLEAYVDDMVIKSKTELDMIKDIEETLLTLKKVNMKLNPKKCSFGMEEGKFLGYIVTFERIRANPKKTKAAAAKEIFQAMKKLIAELPMLTASMKDEELMVYLSVANEAVNAVLQVERNERQIPTHYVSRAFQEYEALLAGLRIAAKMKVEKIHAFVDSKMVANQVEGSYEAIGKKNIKRKS
uniref:Retrovirus-related Pol polyprotein from transposon 17.6 n=1 Tax=Tanacetum cinerariifolium TaxID=118510 RepID=A0A699JX49_TANCI|nr:retrovirus-related Pol polyprotein from transposon 17.6 [Tanacetum cinerariifolium]